MRLWDLTRNERTTSGLKRPIEAWRIALCCAALVSASAAIVDAQTTCTSFGLSPVALDIGTNGYAHDADFPAPSTLPLAVVQRCADGGNVCVTNGDCTIGECRPPCGLGAGETTQCELTHAMADKRCVREPHRTCTTDSDCPGQDGCRSLAGPPAPFVSGGTPVCVQGVLDDDVTGTVDLATGASELSLALRWRVHLGIDVAQPCPRCGRPDQSPQRGQAYFCEAGPQDGEACIVDAATAAWGGVSVDCPPSWTANVSGTGLRINLGRVTTAGVAAQATLPCGGFLGDQHPSTGNAVCLDDFSSCSSNADCMRCAGDLIACSTNGDCGAAGPCQAAPDQPIACGIYCHCGYCSNDGGASADRDSPCFSHAECGTGETCVPGPGNPIPQWQNNSCSNLICGLTVTSSCCMEDDGEDCLGSPTPARGRCTVKDYIECSNNADCPTGAGDCETFPHPCFENPSSATGSTTGGRLSCPDDPGEPPCSSNGDCVSGICEESCPTPVYVATFCGGPTAAPAINSALGLPGPALISFNGLSGIDPPRQCGDGFVDIREECDDGNVAAGDGCSDACLIEFCGDGVVQPALGEQCDPEVPFTSLPCQDNCLFEPNVADEHCRRALPSIVLRHLRDVVRARTICRERVLGAGARALDCSAESGTGDPATSEALSEASAHLRHVVRSRCDDANLLALGYPGLACAARGSPTSFSSIDLALCINDLVDATAIELTGVVYPADGVTVSGSDKRCTSSTPRSGAKFARRTARLRFGCFKGRDPSDDALDCGAEAPPFGPGTGSSSVDVDLARAWRRHLESKVPNRCANADLQTLDYDADCAGYVATPMTLSEFAECIRVSHDRGVAGLLALVDPAE